MGEYDVSGIGVEHVDAVFVSEDVEHVLNTGSFFAEEVTPFFASFFHDAFGEVKLEIDSAFGEVLPEGREDQRWTFQLARGRC